MKFLYRFLLAYAIERLFTKPEKRWRSESISLGPSAVTASMIATNAVTNAQLTSPAVRSC